MAKWCFEINSPNNHLSWDFAWARGGCTLLELHGKDWRYNEDWAGAERGSSPPDLA